MTREEAKRLLTEIRKLAEKDAVVEIYLKLAEVEAKAEVMDSNASQEFIDDMIINKSLSQLACQLLSIQTARIKLLEDEIGGRE